MASVLLSFLIKVPLWHLYFFIVCLHRATHLLFCWFPCARISVIRMFVYCKKKKRVCQIDCYSRVRWHHSVFEGCTSKLLFFFSLCFDLDSPGAEVWFIGCSKGSFADEATGKVIDSSGSKICFLQVNVSQQTLSDCGLVGLVCRIFFFITIFMTSMRTLLF